MGERSSLSARVRVTKSSVHGSGLFARRRLRKGSYIGTFEGTPTKRDGTHVLWAFEEDGTCRGILGRNALRYLNHDDAHNAEFEGVDLYAIRNIQPGCEIMIDYGDHYGDHWDDD
jgi:hypothetical protein